MLSWGAGAGLPRYTTTAYAVAERFVGLREVPGDLHNPAIMTMLQLDQKWPTSDEVPWCSAFVNYVAWLLGIDRSKDLRARSWLLVGESVMPPVRGFDIVILARGSGLQPDATVIDAPGHVGFFAGYNESGGVRLLGGNQSDAVSVAVFSRTNVLGYRRLWP